MIISSSNVNLSISQRILCIKCKVKNALTPHIIEKIKSDIFQKNLMKPDFKRINQPISSEKEYLSLLNNLKKCLKNHGLEYAYFSEFCQKTSRVNDIFEEGLLPYCGVEDCSRFINRYLSGRLTKDYIDKKIMALPKDIDTWPDIIRLIEYSLKHLDKKYGIYQGIVYRKGFMSEKPSQYISTSLDTEFSTKIKRFDPDSQYSIIKVENGHKIVNFQEQAGEMGKMYARTEKEILLPFENEYKKLSEDELTEDLRIARENFASHLFEGAQDLFLGKAQIVNGFTKEDLLNKIDVYVQKI